MRERRSSSTTSRSGPITASVRIRLRMRSASNSIIVAERVGRHRLVEGGVVVGGEGVLAAADLGDLGAELAGRMVGRALEHQVLEEMRDAGFSGRLVGAADLVPDHMGDDRRAMVGDNHDFHAVVEQELEISFSADAFGGALPATAGPSASRQRGAKPRSLDTSARVPMFNVMLRSDV